MHLVPSSQLYEPLRTTLDKSIAQSPELELTKSRAYEQMGSTSRISRRMRSLSPQQANYIKSSTIIPLNKDLVPTDHLWRVRGKQFSAVNIEVRQGPPIPASAIRIQPNMRGGQVTTETVYEIRPRGQIQSLANTRSITNLRTVYPPQSRQTIHAIPPVIARPSFSSLDIRRPASPIRVSAVPNMPSFRPSSEYQIQQRTDSSNMKSRSNLTAQRSSQVQDSFVSRPSLPPPFPEKQQTAYNKFNDYDMRVEPKQKYKYNFFSALDQAVNTKCGSCGANEIIASKPMSSWQ